MTTLYIPRDVQDSMDEWKDEQMVCVFCDNEVAPLADSDVYVCCDTYKGIMTVREWEDYTGETWD